MKKKKKKKIDIQWPRKPRSCRFGVSFENVDVASYYHRDRALGLGLVGPSDSSSQVTRLVRSESYRCVVASSIKGETRSFLLHD